MKQKDFVKMILVVAVLGVAFSGYLTASELSGGAACPAISSILGLPVCVYGLIIYTIIMLLAILALKVK